MSVLAAVQAIIAAGFLLAGLVTLFGIGITGLLFLVPAIVFAGVASLTEGRSRCAVLLALASDAVLAYFAVTKIQEFFDTTSLVARFGPQAAAAMKPKPIELVVPVVALILVSVAASAAVIDWRRIRASPWF